MYRNGRSTLPFRFGPIGPAGPRLKAEVAGEIDEGSVVDNEPVGVLADDRRLHAIVKDRTRRATDRLQSGDVATQDALQIQVQDEPRPDQAGVAKHRREQPDNAFESGSSTNSTSNLTKSTCAYARRLEAHLVSGTGGERISRTRSRTML